MNTTTNEAPKMMTCLNCGGLKILPQFARIDGGICYACDGTGEVEISNAAPVERAPIVMTRGKWISVMNESIIGMKNLTAEGCDWETFTYEDGSSPAKEYAWKIANYPHADVVTRAKAAARRILKVAA